MRAIRKRRKKNKDGKCDADGMPTERTEPLAEHYHGQTGTRSRSTTRDTILHFREKTNFIRFGGRPDWRMAAAVKRGHSRSSALKSREKTSLFTVGGHGEPAAQQWHIILFQNIYAQSLSPFTYQGVTLACVWCRPSKPLRSCQVTTPHISDLMYRNGENAELVPPV